MPAPVNRSLAHRMTLAVLVLSLALGVLSTGGLFVLEYRAAADAVEEEFDRIGRLDVPGVGADLWAMDREQLQLYLDALCAHPNIVQARVEAGGQVVAVAGGAFSGRSIDRSFPLRHSLGARTIDLGTLHVQASLTGFARDLRARLLVRLAFLTAQVFIVGVCMLVLFRWLVTLRLSALERLFGRFGAGELAAPVALPRSRIFAGEDELDRVAHAAAAMAASLREAFGQVEEQRERLAVTLRSIGDGVITTDTRGAVVMMNETAERLTGWAQGAAAGRPLDEVFAILHEETRERCANPVDRVLKTGEIVELANHTALVRRDGSEIVIADSAAPIRDGTGAIVGVVLVFRDVTERKRAEAALRESEAIFTHFMEHSPIYVFFKDENIRSLRLSRNYETLLGKPLPELLGKNMDDLFPSELARSMVADDQRVLREGRAVTVEEQFAGRTYSTIKFPVSLEGGSRCLAGYTIDITERKRAEEALRESESWHRTILQTAMDGFWVTDLQGRLLEANEAYCRMSGYSSQELQAMSIPDLEAVETGDDVRARIEALVQRGEDRFETRHRRKDGSLIDVEVSVQYRPLEGGRLVSFIRDITERVRAAEAQARLEEQLRQSQKAEAIGRLAGGVAHDFNNLTAIVLGYGELLLAQLRPEDPLRAFAAQIVAAGQRSATLTRQLLAFGRKQTLQPVALDLNALLADLEKMLGRLIGEDIELELRLAAGLGRVTADPGQVEQVVTNLVLNARDAMPRGGRLTIETADEQVDEASARRHPGLAPGRYVLLALTDTGCGMDQAALARLFEPFYTTKEKGKGTGLGLATAYGIVKQSGGYIAVSSEPGRGTTFSIYLPRTEAPAAASRVVEPPGAVPRGCGELVLLVEDEAPLRELCATVLAQLGYRVSAAGSGAEALALVEQSRLEPDLLLSDVIMPGMSGAELAQRLRVGRAGLRVLFMSGYPDEVIAPHGILEAGTRYIQKPFTERALALKVREALAGGAAAARPGRRVLMIDDDAQARDLTGLFCARRGHGFAGVDSAAAALALLAAEPIDVLLVDLNLPGTSGVEVLREIRAAGHAAPAVVLTGDVPSADMTVLGPLGVVRIVGKSGDPTELLQAIDAAG